MKRLLLFFFCLGAFIPGKGQAPGYMGKKTLAGYGFYINPAIAAAITDYGTSVINTQHEFFLERALKRSLLLGVSLKLYKTTYNNTGEANIESRISGYYGPGYYGLVDPEGSIHIKARNYAVYFKFFRRKYVAPWGKYMVSGLTLNTRECTYDTTDMKIVYSAYVKQTGAYGTFTYSSFGPIKQEFIYPDLLFGFGNSRIIKHRFVLDYGYTINLFAFTAAVVDVFDDYHPRPEKYVEVNSGMRLRSVNRFNFFMKLGYLF